MSTHEGFPKDRTDVLSHVWGQMFVNLLTVEIGIPFCANFWGITNSVIFVTNFDHVALK